MNWIPTVNVIEINDDMVIMSLKSFPNTHDGHLDAQSLFCKLLSNNREDTGPEDLRFFYNVAGYSSYDYNLRLVESD